VYIYHFYIAIEDELVPGTGAQLVQTYPSYHRATLAAKLWIAEKH